MKGSMYKLGWKWCKLPKMNWGERRKEEMFVKIAVDGVKKSRYDKRAVKLPNKAVQQAWYRKGELDHVYTGNYD